MKIKSDSPKKTIKISCKSSQKWMNIAFTQQTDNQPKPILGCRNANGETAGQDGLISLGKLTLTLEWQDRGRRSAVSGIRFIVRCINKAFIHEAISRFNIVPGRARRRRRRRQKGGSRESETLSFEGWTPHRMQYGTKISARSNWRQTNRRCDSATINAGQSVAGRGS